MIKMRVFEKREEQITSYAYLYTSSIISFVFIPDQCDCYKFPAEEP